MQVLDFKMPAPATLWQVNPQMAAQIDQEAADHNKRVNEHFNEQERKLNKGVLRKTEAYKDLARAKQDLLAIEAPLETAKAHCRQLLGELTVKLAEKQEIGTQDIDKYLSLSREIPQLEISIREERDTIQTLQQQHLVAQETFADAIRSVRAEYLKVALPKAQQIMALLTEAESLQEEIKQLDEQIHGEAALLSPYRQGLYQAEKAKLQTVLDEWKMKGAPSK